MKQTLRIVLLLTVNLLLVVAVEANDPRTPVVRPDGNWPRTENNNDGSQVVSIAEGISYIATKEGIQLILQVPVSNIKLFALTGEAVWSGSLVQGRFFVPTRPGIYFLRLNNKSYKVVCK